MGLKKYVAFSIILIVAVYVFVFSIQTASYEISILEYTLNLPIAVWIILPIAFLFIATVLHIIFYGFRNYVETSSMKKDEDNILEYFKDIVLENNSNKKFKQESLKEMANILSQVKVTPLNDKFESKDAGIKAIFDNIIKINNGEYVSDKLIKLNKTGKLAEKNLDNRAATDIDYAVDILKRRDNFSKSVIRTAYFNVVENKSMTTIKKVVNGLNLDKEMFLALVEKDSVDAEFAFEHDVIANYAKNVKFDNVEYINLANAYKKSLQPDVIIAMFEKISDFTPEAMDAYLHILFEYEMLEKARDILNNAKDEEYLPFRALLDLKENGKHYTLENLSYCK